MLWVSGFLLYPNQYICAYAGYLNSVQALKYGTDLYLGTAYNGSYYSCGALIKARYIFKDRIIVDARLNPHYDSGFGYETCYYVGAGVLLSKEIAILAGYTTIPEYRISERRIHLGFEFKVNNLAVSPMLSVSASSESKTLRALMGFRYTF